MSGGYWNHMDRTLVNEIFNYYTDTDYGLSGKEHDEQLKNAIKINPLKDPEISGIVYDIFCLLHSYDWAESGDTDMEAYHNDVAAFKERWLNRSRPEQIKEIVDICMDNLRKELYQAYQLHSNGIKNEQDVQAAVNEVRYGKNKQLIPDNYG